MEWERNEGNDVPWRQQRRVCPGKGESDEARERAECPVLRGRKRASLDSHAGPCSKP
jgi:hypothetical protein